jgi:hypothetical protein
MSLKQRILYWLSKLSKRNILIIDTELDIVDFNKALKDKSLSIGLRINVKGGERQFFYGIF